MTETTALVTVVSGDAYIEYGRQMFLSAEEHFHPTEKTLHVMLDGEEGWPAATMCRYEVLSRHLPRANYVYMIDADMRFEGFVGPEILPKNGIGLTATLHPGYVGKPRAELPFESRPESAAYVAPGLCSPYYCGGFVGGTRMAMRVLCSEIIRILHRDQMAGIVPCWHDESCLNRVIAGGGPGDPEWRPSTTLSPAYCHPENDSYYVQSVWPEVYERKIVALDKTQAERGDR